MGKERKGGRENRRGKGKGEKIGGEWQRREGGVEEGRENGKIGKMR